MSKAKMLIHLGRVVEVESPDTKDGCDGNRIRARIMTVDGSDEKEEKKFDDENQLAWCFPLLPKTIQTRPKVGEAVMILTAEVGNPHSQRFYIGPIISQPQYQGKCPPSKAFSLLQEGLVQADVRISSQKNDVLSAFPDPDDVSLVGRGKEDVNLRYWPQSDTSIAEMRAGVRYEPSNNPNLKGNIFLNQEDPAYVQAMYSPGLIGSGDSKSDSCVNVVAGHINLASNLDYDVNDAFTKQQYLSDPTTINGAINNLHPAVKGDKLLEFLNLLKGTVLRHVHPYPGMPSCGDWDGFQNELIKFDVSSILSDYVHLS